MVCDGARIGGTAPVRFSLQDAAANGVSLLCFRQLVVAAGTLAIRGSRTSPTRWEASVARRTAVVGRAFSLSNLWAARPRPRNTHVRVALVFFDPRAIKDVVVLRVSRCRVWIHRDKLQNCDRGLGKNDRKSEQICFDSKCAQIKMNVGLESTRT